jgi:transcriptional regulator with PAS, ATPase and Fis domain
MRRLGGSQNLNLDVRIIAATNLDVEQAMASGVFRQDLFYRLAVVVIKIPPLRDRQEDIDSFIQAFIREQQEKRRQKFTLSPDAYRIMRQYTWPGNVRQLHNSIEYSCLASVDGQIIPETLPYYLLKDTGALKQPVAPKTVEAIPGETLASTLDRVEADILQNMLQSHGASTAAKKEIAAVLGIGIATLYNKLQKHGLQEK